jgi:hypothetical protein
MSSRARLARKGDRVVTPSDEVAVVQRANDGRLDLLYEEAIVPRNGVVSLPQSLCAVWLPGDPRPAPIKKVFA